MNELGRDVPAGDAAKPYMAMADEAFATFAADMRSIHAQSVQAAKGRNLFTAQSPARAQGESKPNASGLMAAVASLSSKTARTV